MVENKPVVERTVVERTVVERTVVETTSGGKHTSRKFSFLQVLHLVHLVPKGIYSSMVGGRMLKSLLDSLKYM